MGTDWHVTTAELNTYAGSPGVGDGHNPGRPRRYPLALGTNGVALPYGHDEDGSISGPKTDRSK